MIVERWFNGRNCVWETNIVTNLDSPNFERPTSLDNIFNYDAHGFTITKSFNQSIPHHSCHAIITCDIHNACFLKPFPLIPHWIPSIVMDTKIHGVNSNEIPKNKKENKIVVMFSLLQCPLNFGNHLITCQQWESTVWCLLRACLWLPIKHNAHILDFHVTIFWSQTKENEPIILWIFRFG
jgi:hypothetical protein